MNIVSHLPILVVINLLLLSYVMPVLARWGKKLCAPLALTSIFISFLISVLLTIRVIDKGPFYYHLGGWAPPLGIEFYIDYFAVFMLLIITGIGFLILLYGTRDIIYELKESVLGWYYTLYLLLLVAVIGISLTNDLFNLFVFIEIATITSCAIISIKEDRECIEASLKYLILSTVGSGTFLLGIALIYMVTGHLNFNYVAAELPYAIHSYPRNVLAAMAFFAVGIGVKAAVFPLHVWVPDAYSTAPTPSSAILAGFVTKIYAVVFIKVFLTVFPIEIYNIIPFMDVLLWLSSLGIVLGSMFAIAQEDIKRMLAYSSVAQIGYIFLGIALFSHNAMVGGMLHIFNHAIVKAMLFLTAGAVIYCTGARKISDLKGMGARMPLVMAVFSIGAFAMAGIPVTNGFISKWYLAVGALDAERPFYVGVILLSSLLNVVYFFPIVINAFFGEQEGNLPQPRRLPVQMLIPLVVLGFAVIFTGIFPGFMLGLLNNAVAGFLNI